MSRAPSPSLQSPLPATLAVGMPTSLLLAPAPSPTPPPHQGHIPSTFSTMAQRSFTVTGKRGGPPISSCSQSILPPGRPFPRDCLYAQWEFLSNHIDTHEIWSHTVFSFLASKEMQSSTHHTATDNKVGEALQQENQKGNTGCNKSAGNSGGGPDFNIYSFALYVRWSVKAKTPYPMSPAKLAGLLKDVFGQNEVCFVTDDLLRGQENGSKSGYTVISAKPTAEQHVG